MSLCRSLVVVFGWIGIIVTNCRLLPARLLRPSRTRLGERTGGEKGAQEGT
jgi:hypothetical protein